VIKARAAGFVKYAAEVSADRLLRDACKAFSRSCCRGTNASVALVLRRGALARFAIIICGGSSTSGDNRSVFNGGGVAIAHGSIGSGGTSSGSPNDVTGSSSDETWGTAGVDGAYLPPVDFLASRRAHRPRPAELTVVATAVPVVADSKEFFANVVADALLLFSMSFFVSERRVSVAAVTSDFRCIIGVLHFGHSARPLRARKLS